MTNLNPFAAATLAGAAFAAVALFSYAPPTFAAAGVPCKPVAGVPCADVLPDAPASRSSGAVVQGKTLNDTVPTGNMSVGSMAGAMATIGTPGVGGSASTGASRVYSTFTFYNRNSSGWSARLKFFSKSRNWVWPGVYSSWSMPADRVQRYVRLSCIRGEKVCYGAWASSNPNYYWGVGPQGNRGCVSCCYTCNGGYGSVNFVR
jgi:hypothetical protein